ncbi:arabinofuranosidase catalytic domain-containing protein [Paraburkholderia sp. MM6662-R1]|uniref:arabinofuranosidase catalytic domain-containing protein n=1 Tax=Paraburkholderia sp. MM6662-R1 TaxID=2991066 RepID=UPI003D199019
MSKLAKRLRWATEAFIGPLDTLGVSPVAAYSLRRLTGRWRGPAIEVVRASDSAVRNIRFTPQGDLDIAALMEFVGVSDATVSTWYDQSGKGYHATAMAGAQPYVAKGGVLVLVNGQPAVQSYSYDDSGNAQTLSAPLPDINTGTYPFTLNTVFNCTVQRGTGVVYPFLRTPATSDQIRYEIGFVTSGTVASQRIYGVLSNSYSVGSSGNASPTNLNSASALLSKNPLTLWLNGSRYTSSTGGSAAGTVDSVVLGVPYEPGTGTFGSIMTAFLAEAILLPPGAEGALYQNQQAYWGTP